ncbi:MAG TPA: DUF4115 domain-containing protein, partial [Variovorax sp.]
DEASAQAPVASADGTPAASVVNPGGPGAAADTANAPPAPLPPAETAPVEAVAAVDPPTAAASKDMIVIVARDETWVTVTEAGGKHLLNRTVKAGETVGLSGNLPLSVVVGRASGVDVQVRGKPFDLTPLARSGGVARFEVKS